MAIALQLHHQRSICWIKKKQEHRMPAISIGGLKFLSREPKIQVLHFTWVAFFLSFLVWFNHAPLLAAIRTTLSLDDQQIAALLILNVALTIPARIVVGMLVDKLGPKLIYSVLLALSGLLCFAFARATSFEELALTRFLLGFIGAGFVVGIRMIAEWFPAKQMGLAQGIYAGFGNLGSAAAALSLPMLAVFCGGDEGWRWALGLTGVVALVYSVIYFVSVSDMPPGSTYFMPKKSGAMEVTSRIDLMLYVAMQVPLFLALGVLAWKLGPSQLRLLSPAATNTIYAILALLYIYQVYQIWRVNKSIFTQPVAEIHRYRFSQVAVLNLAYMTTFGSQLAVVSMLPLYFMDTFDLSPVLAGLLASGFAFTNFFARPAGGWLSDRLGRRLTLLILLIGTAAGYLAMSLMAPRLGLAFAAMATIACSLFVNAGNGAIYAMIPAIKRRLTGQIAGMVGAYGNVGGVLFLTALSFVSPSVFFIILAVAAVATFVSSYFFLDDPKGMIAEMMPDGTVTMIEVT
jgi:NNP family nitrate/nitrite transporter-like MFS transporter